MVVLDRYTHGSWLTNRLFWSKFLRIANDLRVTREEWRKRNKLTPKAFDDMIHELNHNTLA